MNPRPPPLNSLRARLLVGSGMPLMLFVGVTLVSLIVLYHVLDDLALDRRSHQVVVQTLEEQSWVIAGALVVVTPASLLIAWPVSRSVTGPIDRLRKAAGSLLAGRFEMEPPKGPNEIAQLIVDFNQIGLSLAQQRQQSAASRRRATGSTSAPCRS